MKNIRIYLSTMTVLLLSLTVIGCNGGKKYHAAKPKSSDSLYSAQAAMSIYPKNPSRALEIIDSGVARGVIAEYMGDFLRARIYRYPSEIVNRDTARQLCVALLKHDSVKNNLNMQFNVLDELRSIAYAQDDDADLLKWSTRLVDVCRRQGDRINALRTEAEIGRTLTHLGQREKGLQMLDDVIAELDGVRKFSELDACIIAMKRKILVLIDDGQWADAIALSKRMIEKCDDYEQHPTEYADDSFRQPPAGEEAGYCDFYRSQAYCYLAKTLAMSGKPDDARRYVALFENTDYGRSLDGRMNISSTWVRLGEYDKMLVASDEALKHMGSDTMNTDYLDILQNKAIAAGALHQYAAAEDLWQRHAALARQLTDSLLSSKAHSFAARYRAQEQQELIERQEIVAKNQTIALVFGIAFALVALALAIYFYRQKRLLANKNHIIMEQMTEAITYKAKYLASVDKNESEGPEEPVEVEAMPAEPSRPPRSMNGEELFIFLHDAIVGERLYLAPDFSRQTIVDRYSVTARMVGVAFAQHSKYGSLPNFIRECRLQYACHMLVEHPEMNVSDIAAASGFSNLAAFSRAFKDKYSLSPSSYRAQATTYNPQIG